MDISNSHNLVDRRAKEERRFGIRVSLSETDPFRRLVSDQWETFYWYAEANERDTALEDMRARHRYSRLGDEPAVVYEPVDR